MNKRSYSQILDRVARESLAANTDLAPRILARIQKGKRTTMQPRMKGFATLFVILLILVIGLVGVPAVRAAIQRWITYVPGIGLVSEGRIRVLAKPVSITRDGITLKVEQVLVDSTQTSVVYSVEGLTMDMLDSNPRVNSPGCHKDAILHLPEEELSPTSQSGKSWITGYQHRASYPVIPSIINEVTFVLPCIRSVLPGKAPENWDLAFRLIPAPPDMTAFPVIEISTPVAATVTPLPPTDTTDTNAELSNEGISLTLDRAVQMDDGYLIYATLHWGNTGFNSVDMFDITTFHLLDANGQEIAYNLDHEAITESNFPDQRGQQPFVIKTAPILVPGPVTLRIDAAAVTVPVPEEATFTFDPGAAPKPGQVWELNQDIDLGYGHSLRVLRAVYPTPPLEDLPQQPGFSFEMQSETGVTNAMLFDNEHQLAGAGGGGGGSFSNTFSSGFSYAGAMPKGPITVSVESISLKLTGHWEASWTPPAPQAIPTSQSTACINRESWLKALQAHPSLPTDLSGTLAISHMLPSDFQYQVSVARLDGSDLKSINFGFAPSLSPDGTRVVYIGPWIDGPADGLYITDLASGNTSRLPGTTTGDLNPLWSPDGKMIAFTHGPASGLAGAPGSYTVVVMDVDGSNVRQLTDAADVNYAVAWMPDGDHLLYNTPTRDGVALYNMDVQTGESSFLFENNNNGGVAVSPDGKRLAFEERSPLDKSRLFVSNLDGSNRIQLADGDPYIATIPVWSPDGNWLIASVHDPNMSSQPNPTLALILVDACQIIPLPNLRGYVFSWRP
jgi:Tol biopolymer transport system component